MPHLRDAECAWGHKAKLDTGEIAAYDACGKRDIGSYSEGWEFLGAGVFYEVSGIRQHGSEKYLFWKRSSDS